jgi:hypothetical protein
MRIWWLVVLSCGGTPAPKPVDNTPSPPAFTCASAANMLVDRGDIPPDRHLAMRHDLEEACTVDHWPTAYIDCVSIKNAKCTDMRTLQQIAHANAILVAGVLPQACVDYIVAIERFASCDKVPAVSREAMKQGLDAMRTGWNFNNLPPDAYRTAMAAASTACAQGAEAVRQGMIATGCP